MTYRGFRKVALPTNVQPETVPHPLPAPTGGWVSAKNPASKTSLKLYGPAAERLECFFPTETGISIMGGSQVVATVVASGAGPCESLWAYIGGITRKMFAGANGKIFDVTSPASPTVVPTPDVSGQTSNYYSTQNFATSGGNFLYAVNGTDKPELYNGTTWSAIDGVSVPSITGVTTSTLSQINVYRNRLYFVQGGTMNVWALPVGSLGGAAIQISLSGIFQKGGSVLYTATWSLDSGSGLDDNLVVVSTEGEIAIYSGSDPSDSSNFSLVGVYFGPKPLGKNGYTKEGGTLELVTEKGLFPITVMIRKTKDQISGDAHSRNIEPDWLEAAADRKSLPWEIVKWPSRQRAIINVPVTADLSITPAKPFMVNTTTGAWCSRPGWNTRCLCLHQDFVYFGTNDGRVFQMEITGADNGALYYPVAVLAWDHYGSVGFQKTVTAMRAHFRSTDPLLIRLSISSNYAISLPVPPAASTGNGAVGEWDVGLWDVALWDVGSTQLPVTTDWVSINQGGFAIAPQLQLSIGSSVAPNAELILIDSLYETGELMLSGV